MKNNKIAPKIVSFKKLKKGDVFVWQSMSGHKEIHTFHSDAGYGAKTFTDYDATDESSLVVSYSGIIGKISL